MKLFVLAIVVAAVSHIDQRWTISNLLTHAVAPKLAVPIAHEETMVVADSCLAIEPYDRRALARASGTDLVTFVEHSAFELHSAKAAEGRLHVIAKRFDSQRWSKSFQGSVPSLSLSALFLSRYRRVIENGVRQEESALRAFRWNDEAKREIATMPMRAMVRSYLPHVCVAEDEAAYGCERGETIFRIRVLLSPRIACRFPEKREQYAAVFWVRGSRDPRILEVEVNGERLVKSTYDDFVHRQLMSALSFDSNQALVAAGLDPFRATALWRQWSNSDTRARKPANQ